MRTRRTIPVALAALAYTLALIQRPGQVVADTKVHLYLAPGRFLRDVFSLWTSAPDLGHVWASQYGGYAWPMAPWFALGDAAGAPTRVVDRLWVGASLALGAGGGGAPLGGVVGPRRGGAPLPAGGPFVGDPPLPGYA